jgi:hypothetical protein
MKRSALLRSTPWAAALMSATTLAWLVPGASAAAQAEGREPALAQHAGFSLSSPSDTGASDISNLGSSGWEVQSRGRGYPPETAGVSAVSRRWWPLA